MIAGRRERGGVYVLVLVTVAVVAAMIVGSLDLVRARFAEGELQSDSAQAWQHAESAIELGVHLMASEPDWRWARGDGAWATGLAFGGGRITLEVTGADGSALGEDAWQPVRLIGIGMSGGARAIVRVDLGMQGEGYPNAGSVLYANDLVGYWPLTEPAGTALRDSITGIAVRVNGPAGALRLGAVPGLGATATAWFSGGAELELDRHDSYNSVRTVSVWIRPADVTAFACVHARDSASKDNGSWCLWVSGGRLHGAFESTSGYMTTDVPIEAGSWYHVVMVADSDRLRLYVNGVEADMALALTTPYWNYTDGKDIYVGRASGPADDGALSGSGPFRGSICEFALMRQPLTAAEVLALYQAYPAPAEYKILADSWNRVIR